MSWDNDWANRENSGSGVLWKLTSASGVSTPDAEISDPTSLTTTAEFKNTGTYKATLYISDGAMAVSDEKIITITDEDLGKIDITLHGTTTVPVSITIPSGDVGVFSKLDCAIDIDTTGSMGGTINTAKERAVEIVNALFTGGRDVQCTVVDFRDKGDAWISEIRTPLTSSISTIQTVIGRMFASGGGDGPEANLYSIYNTINSTEWRDGSLRVYMHFTDAPSHNPSNGVTYDMAINAINDNNIKFLAINCGSSYAASFLQNMVSGTDGQYFLLGSSATGIVEAIESALNVINNDLTVELVADSDAPKGLILSIVPASCDVGSISGKYFINQRPGSSFVFNVTFSKEGLPIGTGTKTYTFKLLIRESKSDAVIDEVPVKITVNFSD